ncbi:hypothetical protein QBC36DRAFT_330064, partial [Triangularia setosa]
MSANTIVPDPDDGHCFLLPECCRAPRIERRRHYNFPRAKDKMCLKFAFMGFIVSFVRLAFLIVDVEDGTIQENPDGWYQRQRYYNLGQADLAVVGLFGAELLHWMWIFGFRPSF